MRHSTKAALLALGFASLRATPARADSVSASRSDLLKETAHEITLSMGKRCAELVVRRTVHNGGERHDQAMFFIDVPSGGVATGLRTLGMAGGRPVWFTAELMEAEAAARKYQELTGIGGYYPKDPALLSFRSQDLLALQVFPVAPNDHKTVEYTLKMPVQYHSGAYHLSLPRIGTDDLAATIKIQSSDRGDALSVEGKPFTAAAPITIRDDQGIDLALVPRNAPTLGGALAMVPFAKNRVLLHYSIEAAPKLSEVPRGAHVVVVIDSSKSLTEGEAAAAVAMAKAYLSHFKDGRVEILTFDRRVTARHGKFVPAAKAIADLDKVVLHRGNGSHMDSALGRAESLLARLPPATPRRIVVITDLRTRQALTPESLRPIAGRSGAIVHVGIVQSSSPGLMRVDDDDPWAKAVRPTGGVVWNAYASADADAAEMKGVYEEWARPMRLDRLKVFVPGVDPDTVSYPDRLDEGEGLEELRIAERKVPWVDVQGELWARPARKMLMPDAEQGRLWSALVFGSPILYELSEEEMMPLAERGHAVSPVTSLLAVEPGVRPSTEGLDWGSIGLSGFGEGGGGRGEGIGLGTIGTIGGFDKLAFLRDELARGLSACGGDGRHATARVESTLQEIVEIRIDQMSGDGSGAMEKCLEEAGWRIDLPGAFSRQWEGFTVQI